MNNDLKSWTNLGSMLWLGLAIAAPFPASAAETLEQIRQLFPTTVATMEANCAAPSTLTAQTYRGANEAEYVGFICWEAPGEGGDRTGQWLGRLPLRETTASEVGDSPVEFHSGFLKPLTCSAGDEVCHNWLPKLAQRYPTVLQQAEFQCAVKSGTLITLFSEESVAIRCGFFATTFWDEDGDGMPDHEDPVSVDIPLATLPLTE